jgi:large subunit ribosomal protein L10
MNKGEKKQKAEALHQELEKSRTVILAGFEGITVAQDFELRRRIAQVGAKYKVVKNSLIERASQGTPVEPAARELSGTTSLAYTQEDPVALAKVLTAYAKENPLIKFKSGVVEGRVVSMADLGIVANLPAKEELFSKALWLINSPAQRLASTLSGVARNIVFVIQQAVKENRFETQVGPAVSPRMDDAPQMQGHSEGFEVLTAAADWFLNPKPATLSEQRFQELKQKLNDIRNPQSAAEVLDIPRSFSPAEGLGKAAAGALELYRQLLASERSEFDAYWLANVDRLEKQFP